MARRWVFKQDKDQPMLWTWRLLAADGSIEQQATDFKPYGAAVKDAVRNGFNPKEDHWMVDTAREITHHERGRKPLVILKTDPGSRPPRPSKVGLTGTVSGKNWLSLVSQKDPEQQKQ